jgi:hypothetical protein
MRRCAAAVTAARRCGSCAAQGGWQNLHVFATLCILKNYRPLKFFLKIIRTKKRFEKNTRSGARTPDHQVKSLALYRLS